MKRAWWVLLSCVLPWSMPPASASDADRALNDNYKALIGQLDAADQARLRDAQRAWISFRDKECAFKAQGQRDATRATAAQASCIEELTGLRAEQLRRELECDPAHAACVARAAADADATPAAGAERSCKAEVGAAKAEQYVDQCQQVSPATHPPCNVANACALMIDEIQRGCALITKDAPAFCADYH